LIYGYQGVFSGKFHERKVKKEKREGTKKDNARNKKKGERKGNRRVKRKVFQEKREKRPFSRDRDPWQEKK